MDTYEKLLIHAEKKGLIVQEHNLFGRAKGFIKGRIIIIEKRLSRKEKATILLHEITHFDKSPNNNFFDQLNKNSKIYEKKTEINSYKEYLPIKYICKVAKEKSCNNLYELSEELGVTEEFLREALNYYLSRHQSIILNIDV